MYTQRDDGLIGITNSEQRYDKSGKLRQKRSYAKAKGRLADPKLNDGRLDLKFSELQPFWGNYDILETDYESYAFIYSCTNLLGGLYRTEYAFVLSRTPIVSGTPAYAQINERMSRVYKEKLGEPGYDLTNLRLTRHDVGCVYG